MCIGRPGTTRIMILQLENDNKGSNEFQEDNEKHEKGRGINIYLFQSSSCVILKHKNNRYLIIHNHLRNYCVEYFKV